MHASATCTDSPRVGSWNAVPVPARHRAGLIRTAEAVVIYRADLARALSPGQGWGQP